jgi:hypothetical protein
VTRTIAAGTSGAFRISRQSASMLARSSAARFSSGRAWRGARRLFVNLRFLSSRNVDRRAGRDWCRSAIQGNCGNSSGRRIVINGICRDDDLHFVLLIFSEVTPSLTQVAEVTTCRHLVTAKTHRLLRNEAFAAWQQAARLLAREDRWLPRPAGHPYQPHKPIAKAECFERHPVRASTASPECRSCSPPGTTLRPTFT